MDDLKRDRIENAIRHIQTATDVDPWAAELAVEALKTQLSEGDTTSDYISRQAAIDEVSFGITYAKAFNKATGEVKELFKEGNKALNEAIERLKELPSVQPDIIRCKECKWKQGSECTRFAEVRPFPDDFCSRAKRKNDERQT